MVNFAGVVTAVGTYGVAIADTRDATAVWICAPLGTGERSARRTVLPEIPRARIRCFLSHGAAGATHAGRWLQTAACTIHGRYRRNFACVPGAASSW